MPERSLGCHFRRSLGGFSFVMVRTPSARFGWNVAAPQRN
jgi:hypothetical protein